MLRQTCLRKKTVLKLGPQKSQFRAIQKFTLRHPHDTIAEQEASHSFGNGILETGYGCSW